MPWIKTRRHEEYERCVRFIVNIVAGRGGLGVRHSVPEILLLTGILYEPEMMGALITHPRLICHSIDEANPTVEYIDPYPDITDRPSLLAWLNVAPFAVRGGIEPYEGYQVHVGLLCERGVVELKPNPDKGYGNDRNYPYCGDLVCYVSDPARRRVITQQHELAQIDEWYGKMPDGPFEVGKSIPPNQRRRRKYNIEAIPEDG